MESSNTPSEMHLFRRTLPVLLTIVSLMTSIYSIKWWYEGMGHEKAIVNSLTPFILALYLDNCIIVETIQLESHRWNARVLSALTSIFSVCMAMNMFFKGPVPLSVLSILLCMLTTYHIRNIAVEEAFIRTNSIVEEQKDKVEGNGSIV